MRCVEEVRLNKLVDKKLLLNEKQFFYLYSCNFQLCVMLSVALFSAILGFSLVFKNEDFLAAGLL